MANRVTLADVLASRLPSTVGLCSTDVTGVAAIVNASQQRILFCREVGDSSWFNCWVELNVNLTQDEPIITLPWGFSTIIGLDVCKSPIPFRNQFWEFMQWGIGKLPKNTCNKNRCAPLEALDRGYSPVFSDVVPPSKKLRLYLTDAGDEGKQVLVGYRDQNDIPVRTLNGAIQVDGEVLTLVPPFVDTTNEVSVVTGLLKDITLGRVTVYELDTVTGDQRLISFMEPGETVAAYRRYFVNNLPKNCCNPPNTTDSTQVQVLAKVDLVPVRVPSDYLTIANVEALVHEAQAIRYSEIDEPNAKQMSDYHHTAAIRLLQGQLVHQFGTQTPSVSFKPFGSASLSCARVGTVI